MDKYGTIEYGDITPEIEAEAERLTSLQTVHQNVAFMARLTREQHFQELLLAGWSLTPPDTKPKKQYATDPDLCPNCGGRLYLAYESNEPESQTVYWCNDCGTSFTALDLAPEEVQKAVADLRNADNNR